MDPTLEQLDFTGGLTEAERAHLALLDSWEQHEREVIATALAETTTGDPDGTSLLAKAINLADDIPTGREIDCTVYCHQPVRAEGVEVVVGVRLRSRDLPGQRPVFVPFATIVHDVYFPVDERITEEDAAKIGQLVIRKTRWAGFRGIQLTADCTDIALPS